MWNWLRRTEQDNDRPRRAATRSPDAPDVAGPTVEERLGTLERGQEALLVEWQETLARLARITNRLAAQSKRAIARAAEDADDADDAAPPAPAAAAPSADRAARRAELRRRLRG